MQVKTNTICKWLNRCLAKFRTAAKACAGRGEKYRYTFGGATWVQRPLVLAQYDQLAPVMEGMSLPKTFDVPGVIGAFGPNIHKALAIVLTPQGMRPRDKNLAETEDRIRWSIEMPQIIQVVEDFFVLSPLRLLFERLGKMLDRVRGMIEIAKQAEDSLQK
jgi:hypothetical protein